MFERFTKDARAIVRRAEQEAREAGDGSVEAQHLLLALTSDGAAGAVLSDAGLDREALAAALADEAVASLAAVGVDAHEFGLPAPPPRSGRLRFGATAKLALERGVKAAVRRDDTRLEARHVLLGVLAADVGTVPRALALAGVDRDALVAAVG